MIENTNSYTFFIYFTTCPVTFSNTTCLMELYKYRMYIVVVRAVHVRYIRLYALISPGWWVHKFIRSMFLCHYTCSYSHLVILLIVHLYARIFPGLCVCITIHVAIVIWLCY